MSVARAEHEPAAFENRLAGFGVIPVVEIDEATQATTMAKALVEAGLAYAEITFRTDAAADAIASIASDVPDFYVGAGTVRSTRQVGAAFAAGAGFLVAPGFNRTVIEAAHALGIPILPGVATPSEIDAALEAGVKLVKLFPAGALGGLEYLTAIAAPFRDMHFVPTGGVNASNLRTYLEHKQVTACGGTWIVRRELLRVGRLDEIQQVARQAVAIVDAVRGRSEA